MGCAEIYVIRPPDGYNQAARDALAHRPRTACGPRRSLAVGPLIGGKRYYGETPMRLRRDCRPSSGNGLGGWRWERGWRLANLGWSDQPRLRQPAKEQGRGAARSQIG